MIYYSRSLSPKNNWWCWHKFLFSLALNCVSFGASPTVKGALLI